MSKFAKLPDSLKVTRPRCIFSGGKVADRYLAALAFFVDPYFGYPVVSTVGAIADADVSRGVVAAASVVCAIKGVASKAKIAFTVIKCGTSRLVVHLNSMWSVKDNAMHEDVSPAFLFRCLTVGVEAIGLGIPTCSPVPLHQVVVLPSINDGILAFGERDKFDRFVLRLDNFVTLHDAFHSLLLIAGEWFSRNFSTKKLQLMEVYFA